MSKVVIGIGSNINPAENISTVKAFLSQKFHILAESRFETTKPIGNAAQPDFTNGAILIETDVPVQQLAEDLKGIEIQLGRKAQHDKFAPRTIDLDIVVYNDQILDEDFHKRDFLKKAVLEVYPTLRY